MLDRFFLLHEASPSQLLSGVYDPWLVALSVAVAVLTSAIALSLARRVRLAPTRRMGLAALGAGSVSLGAGVWAMHFIGMLAFQFCGTVTYSPVWTVGSMLPSLAAAVVALRSLSRPRVSPAQLAWGGLMMGGGIGLMHYSGMQAMQTSAALRYDPTGFALSIGVAVALAMLALWIHQGLRQTAWLPLRWRTPLAALTMGSAISGMHYMAMASARFVGMAEDWGDQLQHHGQLALAIALITLTVCGLALALNALLAQRQMLREKMSGEARLQALVDTAVDGIVRMDAQGVIVDVNRAAEQIFGRPAAQLCGLPIARLVPDLAQELRQPHGVFETAARRADGQTLLLRLAIGSSQVGQERQSVAFVTDITEAQRRQAELEGVQAAIRRGLVVVEFDLDGRILQANEAFLELTGYTAATLLGRHHRLLCLPEEAASAEYAAHWAALRRGEFRTGDYERIGRDGRRIWIRATYNPILDANGRPLRIVKFVSDLTERHALELDLRQAKARAEQAVAAKSTFLANMSHEIRTPMNAIIGFSEVALDGPLDDATRQHLKTIHRSARSLLGLLNDILDTAKLEHGAVELEARDFSLRQLCGEVLSTLQIAAERKRLALTLDVDPAVPAYHRGDPLRLQQILLNLVGNAVKFTERGAVGIEVHPAGGGGLEIAVRDTGIGIPADRIAHIFDPFAQADATMTRRFGGTGLGTTIARQLTQLMGGTIGVDSTLGQGSRFWLRLTLPEGCAPRQPRSAAPAISLPPLRVLVADDVPENLALMQLRLSAMGHTVICVPDGRQALDAMLAGGLDLALLDVQMPGLDGPQACQALRRQEALRGGHLPVVALTASASESDRVLTDAAGMDGFAVKPIDWPLLLAEMARALGLHAGDTTPAAGPPPEAPQPALPEAVDWPQALGRWGDAALWQQQLRRFLTDTLARWSDEDTPAPARAHRLRGACANFGLTELAAHCARLEADASAPATPWTQLEQRLRTLAAALEPPPSHEPVSPPAGPPPWPAEAAQALADALARGELPDDLWQQVLAATPAPWQSRLREAVDGFDFDEAAALLARLMQEMR